MPMLVFACEKCRMRFEWLKLATDKELPKTHADADAESVCDGKIIQQLTAPARPVFK